MRHVARVTSAVLIAAGLSLGVVGCGVVDLPERTALPTIALPTSLPTITLPTRDPGEEPQPEETSEAPPPTEEVPPESEAELDQDAAEEEPAEVEEAQRTTWWPFLIVVIVGAVLLFVLGRRGRAKRDWDKRRETARDDLRWLEGALVPEILAKATAADASAAWQGAKPRVLRIDEELYALQSADVDDERVRLAASDLAAMRALVNAVDAETSTLGPADAAELRARRAAVEQSRFEVRDRLRGGSR